MLDWLGKELQGFFELFLPAACPLCLKTFSPEENTPFCGSCLSGIFPLTSGLCSRCALPFPATESSSHFCESCSRALPPFLSVHPAGVYAGELRQAIHRFKYEGAHYLDRPLAKLLEPALGLLPSCDLIVPVPLHGRRLRERTYNQSLLLARELGGLISRPVVAAQLQRVRDTRQQQGLRARERERNLRDAFSATKPFDGEQVLLVDDVMTTGATAIACSRVLLAAGAASVRVAVVARADRG